MGAGFMLERLLQALLTELKLEGPLQQDKEQFFVFALNPQTEVKIKALDPGVLLFGQIGPCPEMKKEELFSHLMKANFLGQGTGGGCIGLDESGNILTLSSVVPYDMNFKMFRDAVEDFVNYIDYWKAELIRHKETS